MNKVEFADLRRLKGRMVDCYASPNLSDKEYANNKNYMSTGTIKDYLDDPQLAMRKRVLHLTPQKPLSDQAKKAVRIGKALHALLLEGVDVYKENFPVFTADKRGKAWANFKEEHPEAAKNDQILSKSEELEIDAFQDVGKRAIENRLLYYKTKGWELLDSLHEVSFLATYANGYKIKVRCDSLNLLKVGNDLFFEIVDMKTTVSSAFLDEQLANAISNFHYAVNGATYLDVVQEALQHATVWQQLGIDKHLPSNGQPLNPFVQFNLFWVSKETCSCKYHEFLSYAPVVEESWSYYGCIGYYAALIYYYQELQKVTDLVAIASQGENKGLLDAFHKGSVDTLGKRTFWKYAKHITNIQKAPLEVVLPFNEETLRQEIDKHFPPPPPPTMVLNAAPSMFESKPKEETNPEEIEIGEIDAKDVKKVQKGEIPLSYDDLKKMKKGTIINHVLFAGLFKAGAEKMNANKVRSAAYKFLKESYGNG